MRTADWACQWCGYPLLTGGGKRLEKTYEQLKNERLEQERGEAAEPTPAIYEQGQVHVEERGPEGGQEIETKPAAKSEFLAELDKTMAELEARVASRMNKHMPAQETAIVPAPPAIRMEPETGPGLRDTVESEPEVASNPMPERAPETEPEVLTGQLPEPVTAPQPEPALISQQESVPFQAPPGVARPAAEIEVTVEELLSAYEADASAAQASFANKIVKATGVVSRIEVKERADIYYVNLTNEAKDRIQNVRCIFGKEKAGQLNGIVPGQALTVQGRFDGSVIDIRMRDCFVVP